MARALAAVMSACLLAMGSVAVSGVSATAAPAASDSDARTASVETDAVSAERTQMRTTRHLHWSHHNDRAADGDIHLGTDFFIGAGGVGADPAFTPMVGGGFAQASASASASASAHAHGGARSHGGGHRR